jgi:hypothetical protein
MFCKNLIIPGAKYSVYDNNYSSIIDIYFYETFSTLIRVVALNSLDTRSDVRIKAFMLLF